MLNRTHLVITIFFILLFFPLVSYKFSFVIIALISSLIPDVDVKTSFVGKYKLFRPMQFFVNHRGFFHCLFFMFTGIVFFLSFYPVGAFGFFIGYSSHLIADSFTLEGVRLFYPAKFVFSGRVKTGGSIENLILIIFSILDVFLLIVRLI